MREKMVGTENVKHTVIVNDMAVDPSLALLFASSVRILLTRACQIAYNMF